MNETRPNTEEVAVRCERYLGELREFFGVSGVRFGSPEDLTALTKKIREDNVFHDELSSMTRSIVFREGGALPPAELLSLVAVAAGGAQINEQAQQLPAEMRDLLRFLAGVIRTPVNQPRAESSSAGPAYGRPDRMPAFPGPVASPVDSPAAALQDPAAPERGRPSQLASGMSFVSRGGKKYWWVPASGVALAAFLLLRSTHSNGRPAVVQPTLSPTVARAPEIAARPTSVEEVGASPAVASTDPDVVSALPATKKNPALAEEVPTKRAVHSEMEPNPRRLTAAPAGKPANMAAKVKKDSVPLVVAANRPDRAGHAVTQVKAQPKAASLLSLPPASEPVDPELSPGEHSPGSKITSNPNRRGVLDVSSGVMSANLLSAPNPEYPKLASAMHLQGAVILQAIIGRDGLVLNTHVLRGHFLLRGAAVQAVRKWRYRPFVADGHPVDVATVVTVDFRRKPQ